MSVKVIDFTQNFQSKTKQRASLFLRLISDRVVSNARPNTPYEKGNLSRDTLIQVLSLRSKIEWRKVYAQYQERGARKDGSHKVRRYTTPRTGPHFAENAIKKAVADTSIVAMLAHLI